MVQQEGLNESQGVFWIQGGLSWARWGSGCDLGWTLQWLGPAARNLEQGGFKCFCVCAMQIPWFGCMGQFGEPQSASAELPLWLYSYPVGRRCVHPAPLLAGCTVVSDANPKGVTGRCFYHPRGNSWDIWSSICLWGLVERKGRCLADWCWNEGCAC